MVARANCRPVEADWQWNNQLRGDLSMDLRGGQGADWVLALRAPKETAPLPGARQQIHPNPVENAHQRAAKGGRRSKTGWPLGIRSCSRLAAAFRFAAGR